MISPLRSVEINNRSGDAVEFAERLTAALFEVKHAPNEANWHDCQDIDTGTKYEVKSTHVEIGEEYPAEGRFRLWRSQRRSLIASRSGGKS